METRLDGGAAADATRGGVAEDGSRSRGAAGVAGATPSAKLRRASRVAWRVLLIVCRFGLAAMWLFAAGAKLATARDFAKNVGFIVGDGWAWPVMLAVVAAELVAAALLIIPRTVRAGALASGALLAGFAGFALYYVYVMEGEPLECGCFGGIIASQLGVATALRNLALLVPACVVFFGHRRGRLP